MIGLKRHPGYRELSEFSDGTLDPRRLARVSRHLERCSACRSEVGTIRDADEAMRRVPVPPLPDDILERVLERRDSNVRTILPATGPVAVSRRPLAPGLVTGIAVIVVAAIGVAAIDREAGADASVLEIEAESPAVTSLALRYEPGAALGEESEVRVRARIWSAGSSESTTGTVGMLRRSGSAFEGEAALPADAAFALIALEDATGSHVDVHGGDFWEYVAGGSAAPTTAARAARLDAMEVLSLEGLVPASEVRIAAVAAAQAAPDDIDTWGRRASHELRATTDSARRAEILDVHREQLAHLESMANGPEEFAMLFAYAASIDDHEASAEFLRRLEQLDPEHDVVFRERITAMLESPEFHDDAPFDEMEALWPADGPNDGGVRAATLSFLAGVALGEAYDRQDPALIETWARRFYRVDVASRDGLVEALSRQGGMEVLTIELARERLAHYETLSDGARPLHQSRGEFEAVIAGRRAALLAAMATAVVARGDSAEARDMLQESLELVWDPGTARELIAITGDDDDPWSERRRLARLVEADPLSTESPLPGVAPTEDEIRAARAELVTSLTVGAPTGEVPAAAFRSRVGREVPIDDGGVTVVALWQVVPGSGHEDHRPLEEYTPRLTESGVRVLFATPESSLDDAIALASAVGARPVVDDAGIAAEGFGTWYAYAYVVVHEGWYSVHYDFEEAARLALLRSEG